ncbi:MAG TPA: AI-2E family transporter [Cyanobacteria bacterium UBA8803]|nr:AI-2E family transporter [Cyanobacteria bacterium UBA9273]HBL59384.1 AI-2E family transporter [Cyanobacteria bacterium UBA8803]
MSEQRIVISTRTILLIVVTSLLLVLLWQLSSLIVILMIAIVLAATLAPIIERAERLNIPRWLAVLLVYLSLLAVLMLLGLSLGPTVIDQIERLLKRLPTYLEVLQSLIDSLATRLGIIEPRVSQFFDPQTLTSWAIGSSQELVVRSYGVTRGFVGGVISLILAFVLSGYMLSGSNNLIKGLVSLFPKPWDERLAAQVKPMSRRMGSYIQGRLLVSVILGIAISIGLLFLGISEFALGLGAIAGVTDLIPFFGPILGAIPALIVALAQGGWTFFWVLLLFAIVQNLETYVLDPLLVGSSVRVHPLYQLLAVVGGAQVLGIIGALIVPPWIAGASVLLENLYLQPKRLAEQEAVAIASDYEQEVPDALSVKG